MSLPGRWKPK
nr:Chain P, HIV-1 PROTEASE PEPTIDE [unidentified]2HRP_Q Chain Q, HIV-1 PROTEASE PEPTIDE [unidentified]